MVTAVIKLEDLLAPWKKSYEKHRWHIKKQKNHLWTRSVESKLWFSCSHVRMWELGHRDSWVPKNWYFWTVVLEKTLESPLDCKEIKSVDPKGNHPWIFFRRTDIEAEATILQPTDAKNWLIGKDPDAGKDWGQEEKGATEGEMFGWYRQLNVYEFEQALGDTEGQGSLTCCISSGCKESDTY